MQLLNKRISKDIRNAFVSFKLCLCHFFACLRNWKSPDSDDDDDVNDDVDDNVVAAVIKKC